MNKYTQILLAALIGMTLAGASIGAMASQNVGVLGIAPCTSLLTEEFPNYIPIGDGPGDSMPPEEDEEDLPPVFFPESFENFHEDERQVPAPRDYPEDLNDDSGLPTAIDPGGF